MGRLIANAPLFMVLLIKTSTLIDIIATTHEQNMSKMYDDIPTSLLIDGVEVIAEPLTNLINRCLENSLSPSAEKCSKIVPVYTSDERSLMDNYRPISVLPVLSKVFEQVVHQQLFAYLEENNLLMQRQFGFRKR